MRAGRCCRRSRPASVPFSSPSRCPALCGWPPEPVNPEAIAFGTAFCAKLLASLPQGEGQECAPAPLIRLNAIELRPTPGFHAFDPVAYHAEREDRMNGKIRALLVAGALLAVAPAAAQTESDFYRGATIRLVIGLPPGASYDDIARLAARHLRTHIPGRPKIVAENMPGATGRVAASYLFNAAPKDGTVLAALHESVALAQALGESGVRYDARGFGWVGSAVQPDDVLTLWHSAGVRSIEEARAKPLILGATTATANNFIHPTLANNLLGTRFTIVVGYEGGNAIDLAMERGEVQGRGSNTWNTWKSDHPDWI